VGENELRADVMRRPDDLGEIAGELWDDTAAHIAEMGLLTPSTRDRFVELCRAYGRMVELGADVEQGGMTWTDADGVMHRRQAALERDALGWRVLELLREFGMTPRSRYELVTAGRLDPKWLPGR